MLFCSNYCALCFVIQFSFAIFALEVSFSKPFEEAFEVTNIVSGENVPSFDVAHYKQAIGIAFIKHSVAFADDQCADALAVIDFADKVSNTKAFYIADNSEALAVALFRAFVEQAVSIAFFVDAVTVAFVIQAIKVAQLVALNAEAVSVTDYEQTHVVSDILCANALAE